MATETINRESGNVVENTAMDTYKVKMCKLMTKDKGFKTNTLLITLDKPVKCMAKDKTTGLYTESTTDVFSIPSYGMDKQLETVNESMPMFISCHDNGELKAADYAGLLLGSEIVLTNEKHLAGEIIDNSTLDRDKYYTTLINVLFCDRAKTFVKNYFESQGF